MSTAGRQHIDDYEPGEPNRYVFTVLVRCPKCNGTKHRVYGHDPNAERKTQYARCTSPADSESQAADVCGHQFKIVFEDSFNGDEL